MFFLQHYAKKCMTSHFKGHVKHNDKWWYGYSAIKERYNPQKWKTGQKILKSEQVKIRRTIPHIASSHPLKGKKRPQNTQTTVIFAPFFLSYFLFLPHFCYFSLQMLLHKKTTLIFLYFYFFLKKKNYFCRMQVFFAAQCWHKYKIIPTKRGSAVTITVGFVGLMVSI